jgi:hypothetical protein
MEVNIKKNSQMKFNNFKTTKDIRVLIDAK